MARFSLLVIVVTCLAGCATVQVGADYNPEADFSGLGTYAWLNDVDNPGEDVRINNSTVIDSIRSSVDAVLADKGFRKIPREQADFLVVWFGAIEQKLKTENINHFYRRYGYGTLYQDPYWNAQPTVTAVSEYEEGRLIIDILDPEGHTLLWRGTGEGRVVEGRPEKQVRKNLEEAVKKILDGFPPN